jgi:hypothetical protein
MLLRCCYYTFGYAFVYYPFGLSERRRSIAPRRRRAPSDKVLSVRSQPGDVDKFSALGLVQTDEVGVGQMLQDRGDVFLRFHLRKRLDETKQAAVPGFKIPEVVAAQQQADEHQALGIVAESEPTVGVEQLVADDSVRHGRL